ncbi:hypothetical protein EG832_18465 [bacterium]|nr:hypothetical protein [bacterium]
MTKKVVNQVQDFLTVVEPDHTYQIVNVGVLLWRHSPEAVVGFLNQLRGEYKKELKQLLRENKTHPKVNYLIVHIFRIRMAIKTIQKAQKEASRENEHEVEPRATGSSGLS